MPAAAARTASAIARQLDAARLAAAAGVHLGLDHPDASRRASWAAATASSALAATLPAGTGMP